MGSLGCRRRIYLFTSSRCKYALPWWRGAGTGAAFQTQGLRRLAFCRSLDLFQGLYARPFFAGTPRAPSLQVSCLFVCSLSVQVLLAALSAPFIDSRSNGILLHGSVEEVTSIFVPRFFWKMRCLLVPGSFHERLAGTCLMPKCIEPSYQSGPPSMHGPQCVAVTDVKGLPIKAPYAVCQAVEAASAKDQIWQSPLELRALACRSSAFKLPGQPEAQHGRATSGN